MIRIFAQLACLGRTIQASFAGVWDVAVRRVLGSFANPPRVRLAAPTLFKRQQESITTRHTQAANHTELQSAR
jgi:hypothetical protein